jgi:hypothetical protein
MHVRGCRLAVAALLAIGVAARSSPARTPSETTGEAPAIDIEPVFSVGEL